MNALPYLHCGLFVWSQEIGRSRVFLVVRQRDFAVAHISIPYVTADGLASWLTTPRVWATELAALRFISDHEWDRVFFGGTIWYPWPDLEMLRGPHVDHGL